MQRNDTRRIFQLWPGRAALRAALGAVLLSAVAAGWGQVPSPVTPAAVAQQLQTRLEQDWQVENLRLEVVPYSDYWTQQGRFQYISLSADRATQGLVCIRDFFIKVFDVTLKLPELFADPVRVMTVSRSRSLISGRLTPDDMNMMLSPQGAWGQKSSISDIKAEFLDGSIRFTAKYKMLFGSDLEMTGMLHVAGDQEVDFEPTAAKVNGIPLPAGPVKSVMKAMNPLVNFQDVPLQPTIESVTITPEYILVRG